jgi:hypothetical protein
LSVSLCVFQKCRFTRCTPLTCFNIINEAVSQLGFRTTAFHQSNRDGISGRVQRFCRSHAVCLSGKPPWKRLPNGTTFCSAIARVVRKENPPLPVDGDIFSMFYRRDVLKAFNLTVPRTEVRRFAAVHNQTYEARC